MFSDPFTAVMALIFLAFIGTLAVFLRIWKELDSLRAIALDIKDAVQLSAVDAAHQRRELFVAIREMRSMNGAIHGSEADLTDINLGELLEHGLPNLTPEAQGVTHGLSPNIDEEPGGLDDGSELFQNIDRPTIMDKKKL